MDADASPPVPAPAGPAPRRPAPARVRIAALAAQAAIAVPGVVGLHPGRPGRRGTAGAGRRVDGVVVTASADGRYEVDLHLVCGLVALHPLAGRVRAAVLAATAAAGLAEAVGAVHVHVQDVADR